MKLYCNRCHRVYDDGSSCPRCKRPLQNEIKPSTPVTVVSASGFERDRITAALEDANIPFATRAEKKEISADAVTGFDNSKYRIEVPYTYYKKTMELLVGINALALDQDELEAVEDMPDTKEEFEDMSPRKRMFVRIISIILLILVVALVITGVDAVTAIIKNLFA